MKRKQIDAGLLEANADKIQDLTYSKALAPDELESLMNTFIEKSVEIDHLEEKIKDLKAQYKDILKPLKKETSEMLKVLKYKQRSVTEQVYLVADHDNGLMITYDKDGVEIASRKLLPEEKQHRLKIEKTA